MSLFLNILISRNCILDYSQAQSIHSQIGISEDLDDMITRVNKDLDFISMEIIKKVNPINGNLEILLINTLDDEISKFATFNKENEIQYFKKIIQEIVNSNFNLSSINALQISNIGKKDAEICLQSWVKNGWLMEE